MLLPIEYTLICSAVSLLIGIIAGIMGTRGYFHRKYTKRLEKHIKEVKSDDNKKE